MKNLDDAYYLSVDQAGRDKIDAAYDAWKKAYDAWTAEKDDAKKTKLYDELVKSYNTFKEVDPLAAPGESSVNATSSSSTVFIVIGVVLVLAAAVGGGLWYKKRQSADKEGGEADDRKLYKSQIASVNAHKKAQKVALVDADV